MDEREWSVGGTILTGKTEVQGEKPLPVPLYFFYKFHVDRPGTEPGPP